ncbi:MAG: hypothetical protein KC657_26725, partial [Myxococcales bacterium]|nr:hypothetical protein [Myxococcales bacterium]
MSEQDPKRLVDEGGPLADLLTAGRTEVPQDHQLGALAAKLGIVGGLGGAGGAAAAAAKPRRAPPPPPPRGPPPPP